VLPVRDADAAVDNVREVCGEEGSMSTGQYETYSTKNSIGASYLLQIPSGMGLSYQKCRLCGNGLGQVDGLWKYAVRHYNLRSLPGERNV